MTRNHKIVAYRIEGVKGGVRVSALTESHRGTRVLLKALDIRTEGSTKEERTLKFEKAFADLQIE